MSGEVRIERVIDAPRDEVFRAWTDPDELRRWWGWSDPESMVTVEFEDLGERTRVVLLHSALDESPDADGYRMGWESGLDKLANTLERG